ncbi:MAG: TylF/MycF/NovP-related O-methyltransferase [Tistlia sp.]|uniref:TylF/MycF/NovP-related O-methyltransferase n=1 Tax=Tistlia sp. TaxID=3057121 RepID=UPI0034A4E79C
MAAELAELANAEVLHSAAAGVSRLSKPFRKVANHGLAYAIMPLLNRLSRRGYVQYRPDRYARRFAEILRYQAFWEQGATANNRGDYARLYFLIATVEALQSSNLPGSFAELGVYKGCSAKILNHLAPDRPLWLFDTFEGFPLEHARDDPSSAEAGGLAASLAEVRDFVGAAPDIHYCQGVFPETAAQVPESERFALVHLDADLYAPTKAGLEFFYPRLVRGGILILHDYHSGLWPGVTSAVDEFLADKPEGLVRIPDKSGTAALTRSRAPT